MEVAGSGLSVFSSDVFAAGLRKRLSNGAVGASALCQSQVTMTGGIIKKRSTKRLECLQYFLLNSVKLAFLLGSYCLDYIISSTLLLLLNCFRYSPWLYPEHKMCFLHNNATEIT